MSSSGESKRVAKEVAYHEAGHATVGMSFGWQVNKIIVVADPHVEFAEAQVPAAERIAVLAAGSAAEATHRGTSPGDFNNIWWGAEGLEDNSLATTIAKEVLSAAASAMALQAIWDEAYKFFGEADVCRVVEALAAELVAHGNLEAERVNAIWRLQSGSELSAEALRASWSKFPALQTTTVSA